MTFYVQSRVAKLKAELVPDQTLVEMENLSPCLPQELPGQHILCRSPAKFGAALSDKRVLLWRRQLQSFAKAGTRTF